MRLCRHCGLDRPDDNFDDGRSSCRRCREHEAKRYRDLVASGICVGCSKPHGRDTIHCAECGAKRAQYQKNKVVPGTCRRCHSPDCVPNRNLCAACTKYYADRRAAKPLEQIIIQSRYRAKKSGVPFDLTMADLATPTHCPVFGTPLCWTNTTMQDDSPSLDRMIPSLGYVVGNVNIISNRANTIKNGGTAAEHEAIAAYMRRCLI